MPIGNECDFIGVVDLIGDARADLARRDPEGRRLRGRGDPGRPARPGAASGARSCIETLADVDDAVMERYLEGEELSVDEIKAAIRRATIASKANPVLCGSAFKNKGVQPMLDAVIDFLPSPLDVPPIEGTATDGETPLLRQRVGQRAVLRSGLQDPDGQAPRQAHLRPRVLRRRWSPVRR